MADKNISNFNKYRSYDKESFTDKEVLEKIISTLIPSGDCFAISNALLHAFENFHGVLDAPVSEILKVSGIGEKSADFITFLPSILKQYNQSIQVTQPRIYNSDVAYTLIRDKFFGQKQEVVVLLLIDDRGRVLYNNIISKGSVSMVPVYIKDLIYLCLHYNSSVVFMAHNHPSGNPAPSRGDILATKEIQMALSSIDIFLDDHLIFTDKDFFSMKKSNWLNDLSKTNQLARQAVMHDALDEERKLFKN